MTDMQKMQFLKELYDQTEGDYDNQKFMSDIGALIGLEKNESSMLAEELIMDEFVELKTLAGGIAITPKGVELLHQKGMVVPDGKVTEKLSMGKLLSDDDRRILEKALNNAKVALSASESEYSALESAVLDIKTLEVQLLSAHAKTAIVIAILKSLTEHFELLGQQSAASELANLAQ